MADYVKYIPELNPTSGMLVRDNGIQIEFWFVTQANVPTVSNFRFTIDANGTLREYQVTFQTGGNWQRLLTIDVSTEQVVTYKVFDIGQGWPTAELPASIVRGAPPKAPSPPYVYAVTSNSVDVGWGADNDSPVSPITGRDIWFSHDTTPRYKASTYGARVIVPNLVSGGTYYFWAQTSNAKGTSPFSTPSSVRTLRVPDAPPPPQVFQAGQTEFNYQFEYYDRWNGGTPITQYQVLYSLTSGSGYATQTGPVGTIRNLSPGKRYYVISRAINAIGASAFSPETSILLTAGGYIIQGATTQRMVPWVKVAGVWRLARSYVNVDGNWKDAGS